MTFRNIPKPEHGSLAWHEVRRRDDNGRIIFGASEAPVLMGVSKYQNIPGLAISKWSPAAVSEPNEAMMRGNLLEPALLKYAEELLMTTVGTPDRMFGCGRLIATLDGLAYPGAACVIVEAKTTTAYSSDNELPLEYYWQVIAQMACVPEATEALVVVLDRFMRLGSWRVQRDEAAIAKLLLQADIVGEAFDRHELPDGVDATEDFVKTVYPDPEGSVELGANGSYLIDAYNAAKAAKEVADQAEQAARDALIAALGKYETGLIDGHKVVTYKARSTGSRWDTKLLEQERPELADTYKKPAGSTRVLRVL